MILAAMCVLVPMSFSNTFAAYLIWGWTALIAISEYVYGFMAPVQFNMMFAVISITLILLGKDKQKKALSWNATSALFVLLALQATVTAIFALDGNNQNSELYVLFIKSLVFCLLMPAVVTNRFRIHAMVVMIVLGLAFHGSVEGGKFFSSGGGHHVQGIRKFGDNNHFALVVVMAMPLLLYVFQYSVSKLVRLGCIGGLILSVAAVIGTSSRGGLVAMVLAGAWLVWSGRRKMLGVTVLVAGALLVVALAPESWSDRMDTIKTAEEDSSFMGRVEAWQVSSAIALANPLTGGGFHAVERAPIWEMFRDRNGLLNSFEMQHTMGGRAAHSVYFEVLGDMGFVGLAIFVGILLNTFRTRRIIRRLAPQAGTRLVWASDLGDALSATMFAYVVGAAALSVAYLETVYILIMLLEVVKQHVISETDIVRETGAVPGPIGGRMRHGSA
jgi:probable O-glycosylation ligase (exosortase A-associated)